MQNNNNIHFGAIKLSKNSPMFSKRIGEHLIEKGFDGLGPAHFEESIDQFTKKENINLIRTGEIRSPLEFANVFIHYLKEAFIVGENTQQEYKMFKEVKKIDDKAEYILGL